MVRPLTYLASVLAWWAWATAATNNSLTDAVEWDHYSLSVKGQRVFINAGEFHYQRLPVPELWPDIFQKFKATGFNAASIYFFWSYHSASEGVYDFETAGKNVQALFDAAKDAGIWIIARAGPYCNAETNAGGLALYGSDGSFGSVRTGDGTYYQSWLPWIQKIGAIIAANQITEGGPVILNQIENELQETTHAANNTLVRYMEQIEAAFRDAGVVVPSTHNEKGMRSQSWSVDYQDVGGAVNVYGLDSYPGGLTCTNPASGWTLVRTYYQWFQNYSSSQPEYLPEFEGGYFTPWGSGTFYDTCASHHDPSYPDLFYKNNIANRVTMQSFYMTYGGTNWGHSAAPVVYTSYDYAAPFRETRQIWSKALQTKLINFFATSTPDLLKTDMIGNGTGYRVDTDAVFSWLLRNPDTSASFFVVQQDNSKASGNITFTVSLDTTLGPVNVPNVSLFGHQSTILVTDYAVGNHTLLYSSADIATYGLFDDGAVLVQYLKTGQTGEFAFKDEKGLQYTVDGPGCSFTSNGSTATQVFTYTQEAGATFVTFSNGVSVWLLSLETAWTLWAPSTSDNVYGSPAEKILILGGYLVRSASVAGDVLTVSGDNNVTTTIEAYVGSTPISTIRWNGIDLAATKTAHGTYAATIPGTESRTLALPKLTTWQSADSLPEASPAFDDAAWTIANKTTTSAYMAPYTLPVLFSSDYGYFVGAKLYRGYFPAAAASPYTAVNITASGGNGFGWNAWLNGVLVGGDAGNTSVLETTTALLALPASALSTDPAVDNVLTVLVDYHGHDETSVAGGLAVPRGIYGAQLLPLTNSTTTTTTTTDTGFTLWKLQGAAGGDRANLDPVRGPMNEGGLYGERLGWHLPGFAPTNTTTTTWDASTPLTGLATSGVRFYTTTFALALDADLDAPLGLALAVAPGTVARVQLWVNGYQYGKFVPHVGPQTVFPVPPGVLNMRGPNRVALSLWAMTDAGAALAALDLVGYGAAYQTAFPFAAIDGAALQPRWTDRSAYA